MKVENQEKVPTASELEILQILWQFGPQAVRFVNDEINKIKPGTGYTTTLKIMQNMLDKGFLDRVIQDRNHIYRPSSPQQETQQKLLNEFVDAAYRGSAASLVIQALGHGKTSAEELEEIKKMIRRIEEEKSNSNSN
ncbi:MAG: BlaI/MecI/CopY family transcriptional regulator [Saprospiraceae bacterium]|nr:BlaI/MecI/CopY family transcriptional regulator [Saprospiraceae bacterium]HMW40187.1 BlaI/MecI/CopY family transcriptional regulator [Saprospiraceae bacterium]HMX87053.1 BlaI/MecI/CopY family transcriptional regulator [Saprospiraceae bacterium]HMZ41378.1 BlaI/MecI/CopY family transcriptional regulator [Saprospiraceae bacterium]HNA63500.1 BlaI/MecI/CopY family transcriptional regulator [Saprospiraceae bacterium]